MQKETGAKMNDMPLLPTVGTSLPLLQPKSLLKSVLKSDLNAPHRNPEPKSEYPLSKLIRRRSQTGGRSQGIVLRAVCPAASPILDSRLAHIVGVRTWNKRRETPPLRSSLAPRGL
jgi:hypothetical protein